MSKCVLCVSSPVYTLFLPVLLMSGLANAASFYGDGFVQLKTVESSSKNSLHVRFRTSSLSGLLFLASGETDFLWVALHSGLIQVQVDLGSGERTLWSEKWTPLNDLDWHSIELQHDKHNITLTVDKTFHTSLRLPGPDLELSVQEGLYVGGLYNLDKLYLFNDMSSVGFRGCLDEVLFNDHNLLSSLRSYSGYKIVYEVSLGCSPEFFATENDSISFFSSKAYMSFPIWEIAKEGVFECEFHTLAQDGLLLYSSARKGDYVALEIRGKQLVAVVRVGGSRTTLSSITFVNEGGWHIVRFYVTSKALLLTLGDEVLNSSFEAKSRALQLNGSLFLGGVDAKTYTEVQRNGLLSAAKHLSGGSFKGCLRNIRVNGQAMGLPNAVVSKDVSVGCQPVKHTEPVRTLSPESFQPDTFPPLDKLAKKKSQAFLLLTDLEVLEGGRAPLEAKHIKLNIEFHKFGVRQSQILFRIEEQPVHGQLRLDVDLAQQENTFSLIDIWQGRVIYVHSGSEESLDFFMFSVYTSSKSEVPVYLKGNRMHRFNITVTSINDAPELSLPEGNLFVLLEKSKHPLSTDMLKVTDPDTNTTDLVFSLLGNLIEGAGYLELEDNPQKSVTSFSYSDLEQRKVRFVHTGIKNSRMAIRVSDGEQVSNTVVLKIMAVTLEHKVANNTGVDVIQGEAAKMTNEHLAVQLNVAKQAIEIRYDLSASPTFGELQRLHSSGEWKQTSTFTQKLLEKERIRYLSTFHGTQFKNMTDGFKCKLRIGSVATDEVFFAIRIQWVYYKVTRSKLEVKDDSKVTLTHQEFRIISKGVNLFESEIHIRLVTLPKRGILLFNEEPLKKNSTFSQKNITERKLHYKLFEKPHEDTKDMFSFEVFSKYSHSGRYDFRIIIKASVHSLVLRNQGLSLLEGESKVITKDMLFSDTPSSRAVNYTVTRPPQHGKLLRRNYSSSNNIREFTNHDILEECILYVHDDSETIHDAFKFSVFLSPMKDIDSTTEGIFNISVQLVNDEKPVRVVDKIFHVAQDSQRLLTLEDLCYHDPDSDFDDRELLYTRRGIPMGELVLANDTSHKLLHFHQRDLEDKRVLFVHKGVSFGRFVLFVSDGKHYTSTLLEVSAQDPFLKLANNTGLLVQKGQEVTIQRTNFSVTTNVDIQSDEDMLYEIFLPPSHGSLLCDGLEADAFTQYDLKAGHVVYHHDDSRNLLDSFSLTAIVHELRLDSTVAVKVYLESHQQPPQIRNNSTVLVEEGKSVQIHQKELEVVHQDNTPDEIVYSVRIPPSHGVLRFYMNKEEHYHRTTEKPIQTFTQEDINAGRIQYFQDQHGYSNDSFSLDITNGILTLSDVRVFVDIIPLWIPLEVSNITLNEGSLKALTQEVIKVNSRHFRGQHLHYHVIEGPRHGYIEHSRIPSINIPSFTSLQMEHEFIYYVHDGSETTTDHFTLVVNATDLHKQSHPQVIHVTVMPVNDETPIIAANKILRVWRDSVTEITAADLSATDLDSPFESLQFIITPPSSGHLALKSAPSRPVLTFTQAHIQHGQLVFVHHGAMSGGFHFQVNDGLNFAPRQIFSIIARSLVLSLERNRGLKVFPGSLKFISEEELLILISDSGDTDENRTIIYSVTSPPSLGRLVMVHQHNSTEMTQISTFSQYMLKARLVTYEQTEAVGWTATDSFVFDALSLPATLTSQTFNIHISYDNPSPEHRCVLLANTGGVVAEGGRVTIDKSMLDATNLLGKLPEDQRYSYEIWYQVTRLPCFGTITIGEQNLTHGNHSFSHYFLDKYGITYVHDDSETTSDSFSFDVYLNPKGNSTQPSYESNPIVSESFNITVTPVNDRPPLLKTQAPNLKLVKGDTVVWGQENLQVVDEDTPPEEIYYTVISTPNNGFLALEDRINKSTVTFTQADINKGIVLFVHDGHSSSGTFYFSVNDGVHRLYQLFSLEVQNVTINVVNNAGLTLVQGQTTGILTPQHLIAVITTNNTTIKYYITTPPNHGRLIVMDQQAVEFDQNELQSGKVLYHMMDMSSSCDSFEFAVLTSELNLTNQVFNVRVKPLIRQGENVWIPNGIPIKLRKEVLDATELASITGSDPVFEIIVPPRHGKLVKVTVGLNGGWGSVKSFSFRDIEQGRIAIEEHVNFTDVYSNTTAAAQNQTAYALNDSFVFLLKAANVQPAREEFAFTVLPYDLISEKQGIAESSVQPSRLPVCNTSTHVVAFVNSTSQSISTTRPQWISPKTKPRNRWGIYTRGRSTIPAGPKTLSEKQSDPARNTPIRVESLPRPASDPLLIILPLLACLLLIIILVVLILVFRHRQEKKAQPATIQCLPENPEEDTVPQSPYLGQPEKSLTVPSVVVTPLTPRCPKSPALEEANDGALVPAIMAPDSPMLLCPWIPMDNEGTKHCPPGSPILRQNQYWV